MSMLSGYTKPSVEPMDLTHDRLCPFCGTVNSGFDADTPCPKCLITDSTAARQAARDRVGPWFVLHSRNPSAPGMSLDAMRGLIRRGQLKPTSIVRTPTTGQLWQFAASVRGLSREFGVCCDCAKAISPTADSCPHCHHSQSAPGNPDAFLTSAESASAPTKPEVPAEPEIQYSAPPAQDLLSMQSLATAFSVQYVKDPNAGRLRMARILWRSILCLLLLAGIGYGLACFIYPHFYEDSIHWGTQQYESIRQMLREKIAQ